MKYIGKDSIVHMQDTEVFDQKFFFDVLLPEYTSTERKIIFMRDELERYKNDEILKKTSEKPAMYSEVYSPKDELAIFTKLFDFALTYNQKIHITGITLAQEIQILEAYYTELGFLREDINAFSVDFSVPLVTVGCHVENLMWKGSDYKSQGERIFFQPPVRESGQNKALFKGITRGVIADIYIDTQDEISPSVHKFLHTCITQEKIGALHLGKVLYHNAFDMEIQGKKSSCTIDYGKEIIFCDGESPAQ